MSIDLSYKFRKNFISIKEKYNSKIIDFNPSEEKEKFNPIVGHLWWNSPEDVLWLYATRNKEDYEGSQTQFGVDRLGAIVWGFFSHCSCDDYVEFSSKDVNKYEESDFNTQKNYELKNVDVDVLLILEEKIKKIEEECR